VLDIVNQRDQINLNKLTQFMDDEDSAVRYWGAVGCLALGMKAKSAKEKLMALLKDAAPDVRIAAAEALGHLGYTKQALPAVSAMKNTKSSEKYVERVMEKTLTDLGLPYKPVQ